MERFTIGIDVGGTKTAYGLFDSSLRIAARRRHPSNGDCSPETFFDEIACNVREMLAEYGAGLDSLRGVGVGMPSFIVYDEGRIVKTSNLVNIRDFAARDYLRRKLGGVPVLLDNDTHVAALAEHRFGAGRGETNMIYCAVSTGIASGFVINGKLFRGSYGWAGETGHMLVNPDAPDAVSCGCGNSGCFMSWCSGSMILRHIENWLAAGEKSVLTELAAGGPIEARHLDAAWESGDAAARRAVEQMAKYLAIWFYNLYVAFNINCFVLGGGLVRMGEKLFGRVRELFASYNNDPAHPVYFKFAELDADSGIIGAAALLEE